MTAWMHLFLDTPTESFDEAVGFWSAVTGGTPSARRGEHDQFVTLVPASGAPWVKLQAVDGPPRVHLDLDTPDPSAAAARALGLGARDAWTYDGVPVQRSPGGLLLCHTVAEVADPVLERHPYTVLDQVCLDIPAVQWDDEVAFWSRLTGREASAGAMAEFLRLESDGRPRILLQRLEEETGEVSAHPDLACRHREADLHLHVGLGALHVDEFDDWSVLQAPGGQVYCLTDRDPRTGRLGS